MQLRTWWSAYQVAALAALTIATLAFAFVGIERASATEPLSDRLLRLLAALGVGYPMLGSYHHPAAKAARWMAAAVTIATIAKVWSTLFRTQIGALQSRWKSNHAVICGVGEAGTAVALALRDAGIPVVCVDRAPDSDSLRLRSRGIATIAGDARDEVTLRLAGVDRARFAVALCGDDEVNAEVLAGVRRVVAQRAHAPITCVVHISDLGLRRLMRSAEFAARSDDPVRLQCVNLEEQAARVLLAESPPPRFGGGGGAPHVLLVGLGRFGESLLLRLARWWMLEERTERLIVSIVDRSADARCADIVARQRSLAKRLDVHPIELSTGSAEFASGAAWNRIESNAPVDAVYVCLADAESAIAAALALHSQIGDRKVPITVRTRRELGLAALLSTGPIGLDGTIRVFPVLARTCTVDLVLGGTNERLAEALHGEYLRQAAEHAQLRDPKALRGWDLLDESLREKNRLRADQIAALLHESGLRLASLTDWDAQPITLRDEHVERLARLEHSRWLERQRRAGWRFGEERDDDRKRTPLLVDWDSLPADERDRNRGDVRALPAILARADLAIVVSNGNPAG